MRAKKRNTAWSTRDGRGPPATGTHDPLTQREAPGTDDFGSPPGSSPQAGLAPRMQVTWATGIFLRPPVCRDGQASA
jgi:hypothetical protein